MKNTILTVAALAVTSAMFGQGVVKLDDRTLQPDFVTMEAQSVKGENANLALREVLNLSVADDMVAVQEMTDALGMTHIRYQQYYQGIKVEFSQYLAHIQNGYLTTLNGDFQRIENLSIRPALNEADAFAAALNAIGASSYAWETAEGRAAYAEALGHQPEAGELVIVNDWLGANGEAMAPRLAFKFTIHANEPFSIDHVYVDAQNGALLLRNPDVHHVAWTNAENPHYQETMHAGHAHQAAFGVEAITSVGTRYSGTQSIGTDFTGSTYRLYDNSRAASVHTKNANTSSSWSFSTASEITDSNNDWVETSNGSAYQLGALDAQWASGTTYDYFASQHGRAGIDDNNMAMKNLVNAYSNWFNAQWSSSYQTMRYGMGSDGNSPLTTLDVGAHELAHGVTSSSSNLVYQNESGALNEGMSDCFAAATEWHYSTGKQPWKIGEELSGGYIRSMDNPKEVSDPDTYMGTYYYTGTADNGGVHSNSAILNHFFYILSEGKTGTNDHGDSYSVTGLTVDVAENILYRMNNVYLTSGSTFADARVAGIQSAIDLYGEDSNEHVQTMNAWYAVGVGVEYGTSTDLISAIALSTSSRGPRTGADATITVTSAGTAVSGASVSVTWSGDYSGTSSGTTNSSGQVSFSTPQDRGTTNFTITINSVSKSGEVWDAASSQTTASTGGAFTFEGSNSIDGSDFAFYPNPVTDILNVVADGTVMVLNVNGQVVAQQQVEGFGQINVGSLPNGLYIVKYTKDNEIVTQRLLKQ